MSLLSFPNPVNEKAARTVAAGVLAASLVAQLTGWLWLSIVLLAGFLARVAAGPRFSPLGQLATRVIAPRLGPAVLVPGPPKRFAQAIGVLVSGLATICYLGGWLSATRVLLALLSVAALLESVFALCLGCIAFGWLMRRGVIPQETCEACASVGLRTTRLR